MSKGIMNRRDKMIWDNSALPTIDDVTSQITDLAESVAEDLQDAYEELDDKIDQAVTDCTYTAGTGISIDEDNVISATGGANYSTTERVVGTWINNKPLYETTMEILNWPRSSYAAYDFSNAGISDIDEIVSEAGAYIFANDSTHIQYPVVAYGPSNFDHYFYRTGAVFYYTYNSVPFKKIIYTIRYTKTTD